MRSIFIVFSLFTLACSAGDDVNTTQPDINSTPETSVPTDSDDAPVSDTQPQGEERDVDGDRPQRSDADATSPAGGEDDDDDADCCLECLNRFFKARAAVIWSVLRSSRRSARFRVAAASC